MSDYPEKWVDDQPGDGLGGDDDGAGLDGVGQELGLDDDEDAAGEED